VRAGVGARPLVGACGGCQAGQGFGERIAAKEQRFKAACDAPFTWVAETRNGDCPECRGSLFRGPPGQ
jgi:hypothetical protein